MRQLRLPIFTTRIKYYSLRVVPPEPIYDRVMGIKNRFEFAYGKQPLSRSKPQITVASFLMNAKHQDFLVSIFDQLAKRKTFEVQIDGFDVVQATNTLCLKVLKNKDLEELHHDVEDLYNRHLGNKLKSFSISHTPHMTISKTTGQQMLLASLDYFKNNRYSAKFEVNHLMLTSRSKHKSWDWEHKIKLS